MIDLNSKTAERQAISDAITMRIDVAIERANLAEPHRKYLGCSYLGDECERKIQLTYMERPGFSGQLLRIFDRGRWAEDYIAGWFQRAGIALVTEQPDGGQFDVEFLGGRVRGHADGIIAGSVTATPLPFDVPALWECKCLGDKSFKDLVKRKLRLSKPTYWGQIHLYMMGLGLSRCLFTAMNGNTLELYHEVVGYDSAVGNDLLQRAERILMYCGAGELVSRAFEQTDYRCRFCDWNERCWNRA